MEGEAERPDRRDPIDDVVLDDAFVRGASVVEASADERSVAAHRLMEERRREARARVGAGRRRTALALALGAIAVAAVWVGVRLAPEGAQGSGATPLGLGGPDLVIDGDIPTARPTPRASEDRPLGQPPAVEPGGDHAFIAEHEGRPVTWDPCRTVPYVVAEGMPAAAQELLESALAEVSRASGFQFEDEGSTDERPGDEREVLQDRYGDRWAPVLVSWTSPDEVSGLAGDVAGLGGPVPVQSPSGTPTFVSGVVHIDGDDLGSALEDEEGRLLVRAVMMHEVAHALGLAHSDSDTELMGERNDGTVELGPGDRDGLAQLGRGPCVPDV